MSFIPTPCSTLTVLAICPLFIPLPEERHRCSRSGIAPVREMSMIAGAFFGAKLLRENYGVPRMIGTTLIASGVLMLTLG